mmetsp:Transcript_4233/g.6441  ORF Transcript_4233/g.6441 Transcript_4233/m.6441 type:complete len:98 (-) Transcript_4233:520-813(-)
MPHRVIHHVTSCHCNQRRRILCRIAAIIKTDKENNYNRIVIRFLARRIEYLLYTRSTSLDSYLEEKTFVDRVKELLRCLDRDSTYIKQQIYYSAPAA